MIKDLVNFKLTKINLLLLNSLLNYILLDCLIKFKSLLLNYLIKFE